MILSKIEPRHRACVIAAVAIVIVGVVIDQAIKHWAQTELIYIGSIPVIEGLFNLTYVQNTGAAFGILQGQRVLLSVLVSVIVLGSFYMMFMGMFKHPMLIISVALIQSGGIGNLIDRLRFGYVIDYLDFSALFGFPVFNFADMCVVGGTFGVIIYVMFLEQRILEKEKAAESEQDSEPEGQL